MKNISIMKTSCGLTLFFLFFLTIAACSAKNDGSMQESVQTDTTSYSVPAEKAELWESLKNVARKDYDVCLEHCGYEQSCLDKCEAAYKNRLANQYKMLTNKKESVPENQGIR